MKKIILVFLIINLVACSSKDKIEKEIGRVPVDIEILRFDSIFGKASVSDLPRLKSSYPKFFSKKFHDSVWVNRINDTLQQQLYKEVMIKYPTSEKITNQLEPLFQHIKYYFPRFTIPKIITSTDYVDYKNKIILSEKELLISLDTYLGSDHPFYEGIPLYVSQNMKESQIVSEIASAYAKQVVSYPEDRSFLSQMIFYGKELYLKDLWIPSETDGVKIGYTNDQISWINANESEIWRNFIENELLFSTEAKLIPRFISPTPFSKFYLEIDNDSPGMVGRYIGWQIVRSFMDNNTIDIQQLMMLDANEIFNKSKYKPKK